MDGETNLQNVPSFPEVKKIVVPTPGYVFVEADLSQAESRIVAWEAGETKLMERYERGDDVHSFVASLIFSKPVKKGDPERGVGKRIAHASNYAMGPKRLAEVVYEEIGKEISRTEATRRQNAYYQAFPGIKSVYQRGLRLQLQTQNRIIVNPFGRKRKFYTPWGDELFRQAYSHYAQSTVADVMNLGLIECWKVMPTLGVKTVAQVHDSLLFEVPVVGEGEFQKVLRTIEDCMTVPVTLKGGDLTVPVEFKWGPDWGQLKEIKLS